MYTILLFFWAQCFSLLSPSTNVSISRVQNSSQNVSIPGNRTSPTSPQPHMGMCTIVQ
uniref:Uncharacterized protein n=1 Tax=Arundo donax TaxID=35708 RepID=A0A0A8ZP04_ARUDO